MGIHAQDTKHGGAWRLSVLFSALDHGEGCDHAQGICKGGSGKIERAKLESIAINDMKVKRSTFFSWLADARAAGILRGEGDYLYIASQDKLAQIFLCNTIDRRKATIPLKLLFKPGWKGIVWAAYLKANHHTRVGFTGELKPVYRGNVVSEKTLETVTGVLPRQQRRLSQRVDRKRQYAITTIHGSYEKAEALNQAARDHGQRRHYFTFNDPNQEDPNKQRPYKRVIAYTKPSRRTVDDKTATPAARGRRRSILESLRLVNVCNYPNIYKARPQQAGPLTEGFKQYERLYLETATQQDRAESGYIPRIGRFGKLRNVWDEYNAPQWGRSD